MGIQELYEASGGRPRVTTDSRAVVPGTVFFALRGERFDGNRFAGDALEAGADWVVADDMQAVLSDPRAARRRERIVCVPDALAALQELAALHRRRLGIPVLAITGSNGKTTTKELTAAVLGRRFRTGATQGNLNNHIGVPLTLLGFGPDAEIGVVEMGASARGEIAMLCRIAQPDYGIITNVGRAHLEGFGGPRGVEAGKGELYDSLAASGGTALVCSGDGALMRMARERGVKTVLYDAEPGADFASSLEGGYNRRNVAAAVAAGRLFGVSEREIAAAVAAYEPKNNRSQVMRTGRNTLLMDCYNANPSSMAAALDDFFRPSSACTGPEGDAGSFREESAAVLGDMLELGTWSAEEHRRAVLRALDGRPRRLWLVGPEMCRAYREVYRASAADAVTGGPGFRTGKCDGNSGQCSRRSFSGDGSRCPQPAETEVFLCRDCGELCALLECQRPEGYRILVKGSRAMGLEKAAEVL